ncbi:MAG: response regulator [Burkholderiales bacterium]|nr:response regulator [Burkholderiales bacterium]MDE2077830.1 response regulator [Burkholderiales bacterium]MDE2433201.1 response regulator [Burkholderiales bacterium]HET8695830.1 response regulator [Aquabacterium sp.]
MNRDVVPTILLVEDDDVAAEAVVRSLQKHGCNYPVIWAEDGQVALDILRDKDADRTVPRPRVILLDLNMPRMDGFEFLQQIRSDPALRSDVVFILTTSTADSDRTRAYHECIAGYMVKSSVGPQFVKLVSLLNSYQNAVRFPG